MSLQPGTLPELPLPALDSNSTKVLLGARPQPPQGIVSKIFTTNSKFSDGSLTWIYLSLNFL